jgi:hypothetical protein
VRQSDCIAQRGHENRIVRVQKRRNEGLLIGSTFITSSSQPLNYQSWNHRASVVAARYSAPSDQTARYIKDEPLLGGGAPSRNGGLKPRARARLAEHWRSRLEGFSQKSLYGESNMLRCEANRATVFSANPVQPPVCCASVPMCQLVLSGHEGMREACRAKTQECASMECESCLVYSIACSLEF